MLRHRTIGEINVFHPEKLGIFGQTKILILSKKTTLRVLTDLTTTWELNATLMQPY